MELLDLEAPDIITKGLTEAIQAEPRTSTFRNCEIAEDGKSHSWQEFGDYIHTCKCGDPVRHHARMLALSQGAA